MDLEQPIIAALSFDATTELVVEATTELATRMGTGIVPVHAISYPFLANEAARTAAVGNKREMAIRWFANAISNKIPVAEPVITDDSAAELIVRTARLTRAQMVVMGGGQPETVARWLIGSTADRVTRTSPSPVFVARGTMPKNGGRIVCPVDGSPASGLGFTLALRLARLFRAPLRVVTVVHPDHPLVFGAKVLEAGADRLEAVARAEVEQMVAGHDTHGVDVEVDVLSGRPADQVLDDVHDAHLLVVGSRGFEMLLPGTVGGVTEKMVRGAWCSVVTVRDRDPDAVARERHITHVAELKTRAGRAVGDERYDDAEWLLREAIDEAPANAALHEALADVLDATGQTNDAEQRRKLAGFIRRSLG
jgi:nucleotide-binding universal stress UspA family protein